MNPNPSPSHQKLFCKRLAQTLAWSCDDCYLSLEIFNYLLKAFFFKISSDNWKLTWSFLLAISCCFANWASLIQLFCFVCSIQTEPWEDLQFCDPAYLWLFAVQVHSDAAETCFKLSLLLLLLHQCKDRYVKFISTINNPYTHLTLVHQEGAIHIFSGNCYRIPFIWSFFTISFQHSYSYFCT